MITLAVPAWRSDRASEKMSNQEGPTFFDAKLAAVWQFVTRAQRRQLGIDSQNAAGTLMDFEQTIWQLRVAGADIVAIDGDQNEVPRKHNEHVQELEQFRYCTEQNLAEITEKLNSLIGYVGGWKPPQALG